MHVFEECNIAVKFLVPVQHLWEIFTWFHVWTAVEGFPSCYHHPYRGVSIGIQALSLFTGF